MQYYYSETIEHRTYRNTEYVYCISSISNYFGITEVDLSIYLISKKINHTDTTHRHIYINIYIYISFQTTESRLPRHSKYISYKPN